MSLSLFDLWQKIVEQLPRSDGLIDAFESVGPLQALLLELRPAITVEAVPASCIQLLKDAGFSSEHRWIFNPTLVESLKKEYPDIFGNAVLFTEVHTDMQDGLLFGFPLEAVQKFADRQERKKKGEHAVISTWSCDAYGTTWIEYDEVTPASLAKLQQFQSAFLDSGFEDITLPLLSEEQRQMAYCIKVERIA